MAPWRNKTKSLPLNVARAVLDTAVFEGPNHSNLFVAKNTKVLRKFARICNERNPANGPKDAHERHDRDKGHPVGCRANSCLCRLAAAGTGIQHGWNTPKKLVWLLLFRRHGNVGRFSHLWVLRGRSQRFRHDGDSDRHGFHVHIIRIGNRIFLTAKPTHGSVNEPFWSFLQERSTCSADR